MAHLENSQAHGDGWTAQITNWLHQLVDTVRDRSVRPLLFGVRAVIIGVLVGIVGLVVLVLITIALFRLFDYTVFPGRVWATDLLFGGIFVLVGAFFLRKIRPARSSHDEQ